MASCSGASSGSTQFQNSGSEGDLTQQQKVMDQRKRKRMIWNRESARRSRVRKQKHLDDLVAQSGQLRSQNNLMVTNMKVTTQLCLNIDAENSVLIAQLAELTHRLESLYQIIDCLNSTSALFETDEPMIMSGGDDFLDPWNLLHVNHPIMASADTFMV